MMKPLPHLLCAIATFATLVIGGDLCTARAAPVAAPHVQVELISQEASIQDGHVFWAGLHFQLENHWHLYWINPGDSGDAPRIKWNMPAGFQAGQILWPTPSRLPAAPLLNYGYEGEVLLPIQITPSPDLTDVADLKAEVKWLVCKDICLPGKASLSLQLPVLKTPPAADPRTRVLFQQTFARLPKPAPSHWKSQVVDNGHGQLELSVESGSALEGTPSFFPLDADIIENASAPEFSGSATGFQLKFRKSDQLLKPLSQLRGVLVMPQREAYFITAPAQNASGAPDSGQLLGMILFAFIGGLILNLMPCVFPVLSIKVLGFLQQSGQSHRSLRMHAVAYTLGILFSFWALVALLIALRGGGQQIGWGFQLQSPGFLFFLSSLLFLFALNLAGVFEINTLFGVSTGVGSSLATRGGYSGSFFTGVLATIVATPCSAPFMGSAVGFALGQSASNAFAVFTALALGLATPYAALAVHPGWAKWLPKPGRWMETLKQVLAFPVFGTGIWLAWVFGLQTGLNALAGLLAAWLLIGMAAWVLGRFAGGRAALVTAILLLGGATALGLSIARHPEWAGAIAQSATSGEAAGVNPLTWIPFSPQKIEEFRKKGQPVFVDFTAAWCVTCKVNELIVLQSEPVRKKFTELGMVLMKADWTSYDPLITKTLESLGRSGVPVYALYAKNPELKPVVLSEFLTVGQVLTELEKLK